MNSYNAGTLIGALCLIAPFLFMALWCLTVLSSQPPDSSDGITVIPTTYPPEWNEYMSFLGDDDVHNV